MTEGEGKCTNLFTCNAGLPLTHSTFLAKGRGHVASLSYFQKLIHDLKLVLSSHIEGKSSPWQQSNMA